MKKIAVILRKSFVNFFQESSFSLSFEDWYKIYWSTYKIYFLWVHFIAKMIDFFNCAVTLHHAMYLNLFIIIIFLIMLSTPFGMIKQILLKWLHRESMYYAQWIETYIKLKFSFNFLTLNTVLHFAFMLSK